MIDLLKKGPELERMVVSATARITEVIQRINKNLRGVAFVVDEGQRLVGVITDGDLRRAFAAGVSPHGQAAAVMTSSPVYFSQMDDPEKIFSLLGERYKYIPVVDVEKRIVGYYSYYDVKMIPIAQPCLKGREQTYVLDCLAQNWISSKGRYVTRFEDEFARFVGCRHALAVSNGTAALHLVLAALGLKPGDEVIVPSLTFVATANAVRYTGAEPIPADVDMETWGLDPASAAELITPRTKAIVPVHLYGQPCRLDEIEALARQHGLKIIEDAAEAHGATYKGRLVGSIGEAGCFSFFGNKIITTGEGGMVVTDDAELYEMAKILRDHGMDPERKYYHPYVGFNYRLTNIQAAIGLAQLERLEAILKKKKEIADLYLAKLEGNDHFIMPPRNDWSENVFWLFSVVLKKERPGGLTRDQILDLLKRGQVEARPFFHPIHCLPPYDEGRSLPVSEFLSQNGLNLPSYPDMTEAEIDRVCDILNSASV